jgi:hypothetical protein
MIINNDAELKKAISKADQLIQAIHDYAGRDFPKPCQLRFPRGYVRTANMQRNRMPFLPKGPLKDNISYTLILSDTVHWLLDRTDVSGTIKSQLIKMNMFLLGSLAESITKVYLDGKCKQGYKQRTHFLLAGDLIDQDLKDDLDWLWDMRNNMHLFLVREREHNCPYYTVTQHNRSIKAFRKLIANLSLGAAKNPDKCPP